MGICVKVKAMLAVLFTAANGCQVLGAVQRHGSALPRVQLAERGSSIADLSRLLFTVVALSPSSFKHAFRSHLAET